MATRSCKLISCSLIATADIVVLLTGSVYEPAPRTGHTPLLVDDNLYLWGGWMDGIPEVHDSPKKRKFLSSVDVFQLDCGDWIRRETSGTPPLGVMVYCCAAVGDSLYYFGGYCGHHQCYHNGVHKLSTSSLQWTMLSPSTSESGAPMRKIGSGMVAFRDGEEDILCVIAGYSSLTPSNHQSGAQYYKTDYGSTSWCNEQHMFSLSTSEYNVLCNNCVCQRYMYLDDVITSCRRVELTKSHWTASSSMC